MAAMLATICRMKFTCCPTFASFSQQTSVRLFLPWLRWHESAEKKSVLSKCYSKMSLGGCDIDVRNQNLAGECPTNRAWFFKHVRVFFVLSFLSCLLPSQDLEHVVIVIYSTSYARITKYSITFALPSAVSCLCEYPVWIIAAGSSFSVYGVIFTRVSDQNFSLHLCISSCLKAKLNRDFRSDNPRRFLGVTSAQTVSNTFTWERALPPNTSSAKSSMVQAFR